MKDIYKAFLFQKHILVNDSPIFYTSLDEAIRERFATIVSLAKMFSIRITEGAEKVCSSMINDASNLLGKDVPDPFYRGFPESVKALSPSELLYDQLLHYTLCYVFGCFPADIAGHSVLEETYEKIGYEEKTDPVDFKAMDEAEAVTALTEYLKALLSGNRPLSVDQMALITSAYNDFGKDILPERIPCKDTAVKLLYATRDLAFCNSLKLSDTIKLLQHIQYTVYNSENLKKLNLKNQDRIFLTKVIDWFDEQELQQDDCVCDYTECFEKRRIWCGLFHHIHYRSKQNVGLMWRFINDIRNGKNYSVYHYTEVFIKKGYVDSASSFLCKRKGKSCLIRNLNYYLSRCKDEKDIEEVLKCLE